MPPTVLLLALAAFLHASTGGATERLPLSHRNTLAQRPLKDAPHESTGYVWKLGLIGLAGISFLIRKRL